MDLGSILKEEGFKPWLERAQASGLVPYYWTRYRKYLQEKQFSKHVLATLNAETDRILGMLQDPAKPGPWSRRGMVVGHVQSGKTANYTGLICKAADAGYKLIVVIAGVHNNLRNQTQKRIDEGFVGRDSAQLLSKKKDSKFIGVGRQDRTRRPVTFTNSLKDFNKQLATSVGIPLKTLNEPAVFVIKKNSKTLEQLISWLEEHNKSTGDRQIDLPMLLIDDEADNASINVRYGRDEVSTINAQIRNLLRLFKRSCYVGYTATPFANIFIDPDTDDEMLGQDLFPRHFIVSLDPPTNYFGADRVFGEGSKTVIRHIDDNEDLLPLVHKITVQVAALPPSLRRAVRSFIVARAIRILRGQGQRHCSMLVNASRFTRVQGQIRAHLQTELESIQASIRVHSGLNLKRALLDPEMNALHEAYLAEYQHAWPQWGEIQDHLVEAAAPIKVVEVNSGSSGSLNYSDYEDSGLSVIAVGGFSLSRGLTLEGLMVSYFLRNSVMYDTLMQMGRWFGYRDGYEDLCRVWMTPDAEGWYTHIAESIEMLRDEFKRMAQVNGTPEDFGLKVRAHPASLIITARNKMGSGQHVTVSIGLANRLVETTTIRANASARKQNREAVAALGRELEAAGLPMSDGEPFGGGRLVKEVPGSLVLRFLNRYSNHPASVLTSLPPISHYINARQHDELALWDILLVGVSQSDRPIYDETMGVRVRCQSRTMEGTKDSDKLQPTKNFRVASRGVEKAGLSKEQIAAVESAYRESVKDKSTSKSSTNFPDRIYRETRARPLLMIHPLAAFSPGDAAKPLHDDALFAWGISFPGSKRDEERTAYVVTQQWMRENIGVDDDDDEFENDDE